uniref:hypothetical protein n=1 Tax=Streptomyces brasiliensis TaxID=1954 RepID=UPI003570E104
MRDVVKFTSYLTSTDDIAEFYAARERYFAEHYDEPFDSDGGYPTPCWSGRSRPGGSAGRGRGGRVSASMTRYAAGSPYDGVWHPTRPMKSVVEQ